MNKREIGSEYEAKARIYLEKQGLCFIEKNYHCHSGEIDLIMQDGEYRVFIEVRFRAKTTHGDAIDTISHYKQRRLMKTAQHYLVSCGKYDKIPCRFDVIALQESHEGLNISWVKNAIDVSAIT